MFKPVENAPSLEVMSCTITDRHHRLLLWYLPHILRPERRVNGALLKCQQILTTAPAFNVKQSSPDKSHFENQSYSANKLAQWAPILSAGGRWPETRHNEYISSMVRARARGMQLFTNHIII